MKSNVGFMFPLSSRIPQKSLSGSKPRHHGRGRQGGSALAKRGRQGGSALTEGVGVDDVAVAYLGVDHPVVRRCDLVGGNHLDTGAYTVVSTEIEHLLSLGASADEGSLEGLARGQGAYENLHRGGGHADVDDDTSLGQAIDVVGVIRRGGNRRQDHVELSFQLLKDTVFACRIVVRGTECDPVGLLGQGVGDDRDLGAQRRCDLYAHMAQAAEPHDGNLHAGLYPALEGGVRGDPGAEQGSALLQRDDIGDVEDEMFLYDDGLGVAALGGPAMGIGGVVRENSLVTELFEPLAAIIALPTGVDHAPHAHAISRLEPGHFRADLADDPRDLMPDHQGIV